MIAVRDPSSGLITTVLGCWSWSSASRVGSPESVTLPGAEHRGRVQLSKLHSELVGVSGAVDRVLRQSFLDGHVNVLWHSRRERRRRMVNVRHRQRGSVVGSERRLACEHFVADHSERIHIAGRSRFVAGRLFGSDVPRRADDLPDLGERCRVGGAGDAEVGNLDRAVFEQEKVARFDVAVHHALRVCGVQRLRRLGEYREHHVDGQRPTLRHHLRERSAGNQFHDEVRDTSSSSPSSP